MKSIYKIIVLIAICFCKHGTAQTTYRDIVQDNIVSARDSARLVHYLIGMGMIEGKGDFVTKRKVYLDSALSIATWSAPLWFEKSYPLFFAGKYEIGMPYIDSAVKYNNKYLGYKGYLQCIFQKHYSEALADLKEAQRVNGEGHVEDHSYEFYIGLCYLQLDKFDSGELVFRHLIDKTKKEHGWKMVHYLDWYYLGISLFEKDDYGNAIACFDTCLKQYTSFSDAKFYKAWCLKELHQAELAYHLMAEANEDFATGYTINDDNARYEPYPYQVNKYQLKNSLEILDKKRKPENQN